MTDNARPLRTVVADQLNNLAALDGPLSAMGKRASIHLPELFDASGVPSASRLRTHRDIIAQYLARQTGVPRHGKAALLTAGPPGAGKTTVVATLTDVSQWRRLDADIIKTLLLEDAVDSGYFDDLLRRQLADGHTIMPAELASLVHVESVMLLEVIRRYSLARGENVVIEGTLTWPPAGHSLLEELITADYSAVTIVDVEVPATNAHANALSRWWDGRQQRIATGHGLGGRFTPSEAINRAFPTTGGPSICLTNARELFSSPAAQSIGTFTLTVYDATAGEQPAVNTQVRRHGRLQPAARQ